jgi:hypothetical protein
MPLDIIYLSPITMILIIFYSEVFILSHLLFLIMLISLLSHELLLLLDRICFITITLFVCILILLVI